jgi:F5/8 type C domain/L,D-transpeptidase catalytic domain
MMSFNILLKKTMTHLRFSFLFALLLLSLGARAGEIASRFLLFQIENPEPVSECGRLKGYVSLVEIVNDQMMVMSQFPTVYGLNGCNKQWRGDKKTPLGKYKIDIINRKSLTNVNERNKFGGFSLVLDYPNVHDRQRGRTGEAIAIHGGRNSPTLGCARVLDGDRFEPSFGVDNIRRVAEFVQKGTPVVFMENAEADLVGSEGSIFTPEVTQFWKNVLLSDLSREDLLAWVRNYRSYLTPVDPSATIAPAPAALSASISGAVTSSGPVLGMTYPPAVMTPASVPEATPAVTTPAPAPARVKPEVTHNSEANVRASSTLNGSSRYSSSHLTDNNDGTAWCIEGSEKKKVIVFEYPEGRTLHNLSIITGYDRDNLWKQNGRAAEVKVSFDGEKAMNFDLKDTRNRQTFSFKKGVKTKLVRVEITRYKKGAKGNDMCISELEFH